MIGRFRITILCGLCSIFHLSEVELNHVTKSSLVVSMINGVFPDRNECISLVLTKAISKGDLKSNTLDYDLSGAESESDAVTSS